LRALHRHRVTLAKWKLLIGEYQDQGLIFATTTGGITQAENLTRGAFRQVLSGAGLPAIRLYDLRHSHATLLIRKGLTHTSRRGQ
jgi:integrase